MKSMRSRPRKGWQGHSEAYGWQNTRPPAVPKQLDLDLSEYYAAAALIGFLSAQKAEPDPTFALQWSFDMGTAMARDAIRRRRKRTRTPR